MNNKALKVLEYFDAEEEVDYDSVHYHIKKGYMCVNETGFDESRLRAISIYSNNEIGFMTDDADFIYPYEKGLKYIEECSIYKIEKIL